MYARVIQCSLDERSSFRRHITLPYLSTIFARSDDAAPIFKKINALPSLIFFSGIDLTFTYRRIRGDFFLSPKTVIIIIEREILHIGKR